MGLAGADDVDAAVAAARSRPARPGPRWSPRPAGRRPVPPGRPAGRPRATRRPSWPPWTTGPRSASCIPALRRAPGSGTTPSWCDKLGGSAWTSAERGRPVRLRALRGRRRVIPPWNGSMMGMGQKCGPGPGRRQRRGGQAARAGPVRHAALRRTGPRGRAARRRAERGGRRGRRRCGAGRPPGRRQDQLHRRDGHGPQR